VTQRLFERMVCRIAALLLPIGWEAATEKQTSRRKRTGVLEVTWNQ